MCVSQFREYCNAFSFKRSNEITTNDEVDKTRGTFYASGSSWCYTKNKKKMDQLKKQNNQYALNEDRGTLCR